MLSSLSLLVSDDVCLVLHWMERYFGKYKQKKKNLLSRETDSLTSGLRTGAGWWSRTRTRWSRVTPATAPRSRAWGSRLASGTRWRSSLSPTRPTSSGPTPQPSRYDIAAFQVKIVQPFRSRYETSAFLVWYFSLPVMILEPSRQDFRLPGMSLLPSQVLYNTSAFQVQYDNLTFLVWYFSFPWYFFHVSGGPKIYGSYGSWSWSGILLSSMILQPSRCDALACQVWYFMQPSAVMIPLAGIKLHPFWYDISAFQVFYFSLLDTVLSFNFPGMVLQSSRYDCSDLQVW